MMATRKIMEEPKLLTTFLCRILFNQDRQGLLMTLWSSRGHQSLESSTAQKKLSVLGMSILDGSSCKLEKSYRKKHTCQAERVLGITEIIPTVLIKLCKAGTWNISTICYFIIFVRKIDISPYMFSRNIFNEFSHEILQQISTSSLTMSRGLALKGYHADNVLNN